MKLAPTRPDGAPPEADVSAAADAHFAAGHFTQAGRAYQRAVAERPDDVHARHRLGLVRLYQNRPQEATAHLEASLARRGVVGRRWPLSIGVRTDLAMACYRGDDFAGAARWFAAAAGPVPLGPLRDLAGLARQLTLFSDAPPYRITGPERTRVDFVAAEPLPVVELAVNDHPPARFLIDTGAAEIVLDEVFAQRVGADIAGTLQGEYGGGRTASTGLGRVTSVAVGDLRVGEVPVHTLDLGPVATLFDGRIDGIVGTRLLMRFLSTIDYRDGALVLRRPPPGAPRASDIRGRDVTAIPFWLVDMHLILARGRLNDLSPTMVWVDTGLAGRAFLASEATLRSAGVTVDWSQAYEGPGGGGMATETDVHIDTLTLGDGDAAVTQHHLTGVAMETTPSVLGDIRGFDVGGLISHAFFRDRALTLDFEQMRLLIA